jgi:hypothetical protein
VNLNDWLALSRRRSDQLQAWETTALAGLTAPMATQLQAILVELAKRYVIEIGSIYERDPDPKAVADITRWLDGQLAAIDLSAIAPQVTALAKEPYVHGMVTAAMMVGATIPKPLQKPVVTENARQSGKLAAENAVMRMGEARGFTTSAKSWGGFTLAMAKASQAVTAIKTSASWAIVASAAAGVVAYATTRGAKLDVIWICDEGACPICLPFGGAVMTKEGVFISADGAMISSPPTHPNCRCETGTVDKSLTGLLVAALSSGSSQSIR